MHPSHAKWDEIEREKRFGYSSPPDPTIIVPQNVVRVRKEYIARDMINSRQWDFFHATPPTQIATANIDPKNPMYMDMKPIPSRTNAVQYRVQPEYIPDPPRGTTKSSDLGIPPLPAKVEKPPGSFYGNSYTQRLDSEGSDARNMIRELRGAVTENNTENQMDADRLLAMRQFSDRWLPPKTGTDIASLQAYELLRAKPDDWRNANFTKN